MRILAFALLLAALTGIANDAHGRNNKLPAFDLKNAPQAPDYSNPDHWSALPFRQDAADAISKKEQWVNDSAKAVDVFYVYPTLYTNGKNWNADIFNQKLNQRIDDKPVHFQASVFNESCRVYAPRYRQAIVDVFFKDSSADGKMALELAYADVKAAFEYYLKHHNQGRPIIIAGHSQGSWHTRKLLQEYFDTTALKNQLVAAYVIGYNVREDMYETLRFCSDASATGCVISWMSYKTGHEPKWLISRGTQSINPLSWTMEKGKVTADKSRGTVVLNLNKSKAGKTDAQLQDWHGGHILWVRTKRRPLNWLKNLHIADYNLFYQDIRENVRQRIENNLNR